MIVKGNVISGKIESVFDNIVLPDGYSIMDCIFQNYGCAYTVNDTVDEEHYAFPTDMPIHFPVVHGKSPCSFTVSGNIGTAWQVVITRFGGKPDTHYFDAAFEPILVQRKDSTEYNLIPQRDYM